jgi:hypothetical protein
MDRFKSNTFTFLFIASQTSHFEPSLYLAKLKNRTPQYKRHFNTNFSEFDELYELSKVKTAKFASKRLLY